MTSHVYKIVVAGTNPQTVYKAINHLQFSLHWSKQFWNVNPVNDYVNETEHEHAYQLVAYAEWVNRINDMVNFSTYYPHVEFTLQREDDGIEETYVNGKKVF